MKKIKILSPNYNLPHIISSTTNTFENLLPSLRSKVDLEMIWIVSNDEKFNSYKSSDAKILDIHDFNNALEILIKIKPNVVFANANQSLIHYSLSLAAKSLGIPVISHFSFGFPKYKISKFKYLRNVLQSFFSSSIPTDSNQTEKKFMKRGRFFIYKYYFLYKTQKVLKTKNSRIFKTFFELIKSHIFINDFNKFFSNDLHWVVGNQLVDILIKSGFDKNSIVVTGEPSLDKIFTKIKLIKSSFTYSQKIRVLYVPIQFYEHNLWTKKQRDSNIIKIIKSISASKNEISLSIKLHPSSQIFKEYESLIHSIDSSIPIYQNGDVIDYLNDVDVVISDGYDVSIAHIITLLSKKPLILCCFLNDDYNKSILIKRKLAIECSCPSKIISSIKNILTNNPSNSEKIEIFVKDYFYSSDGKSSERLANAVLSLIQKFNSKHN